MMPKLPITVITGFVNVGKTNVLLSLLRQKYTEEQSAVIMNDIAEVVTGVDKVKKMIENASHSLLELPNGCICCTLKDVFLDTVGRVAKSSVGHLYVEGNPTAEPSLIRGFLEDGPFADQVFIKNMITVIDASTFLQNYLSTDTIRQRGLVALEHDDRIVSEVLADQVECADTLVIAKCDLVSDADATFLYAVLSALNPAAKIVTLGQKKRGEYNHNINSFSFTAQRPFHPVRLYKMLQTDVFSNVLRAKGVAWIATRQAYKVQWLQMGSVCSLESGGAWWQLGSNKQEDAFNRQWFEHSGSRYQDIEFIGTEMNAKQLQQELENCLLTNIEMQLGPDLWQYFDDPIEHWEDFMDRSLFVVRDLQSCERCLSKN